MALAHLFLLISIIKLAQSVSIEDRECQTLTGGTEPTVEQCEVTCPGLCVLVGNKYGGTWQYRCGECVVYSTKTQCPCYCTKC